MPTILAVNNDASEIAARLLAVAGDEPDRVQVVTGGKYIGFAVDDELAVAAGYVLDDEGQADLDAVPLLIDDTLPVVPWNPGTEAQEAATEAQTAADAAQTEPVQAEAPAAPVEPEAPKPVAEKPVRKTSRSK